jgi:hypothetical protein
VALGTFIDGAYTATLNAVALGITDEGYMLQWEPHHELINKSDVYGDALLDLIYRGTDWYFQSEFMEYKAGPLNASYPWGALGVQGIIGRLGSDVGTSLVLTSTTGTPAVATPATLTATKTILAPNSNPMAQFTSRLRTLPVRLVLLPVDTGAGVIKSFTIT